MRGLSSLGRILLCGQPGLNDLELKIVLEDPFEYGRALLVERVGHQVAPVVPVPRRPVTDRADAVDGALRPVKGLGEAREALLDGVEPHRTVGELKEVGFKFGRWLDITVMQKMIGPE